MYVYENKLACITRGYGSADVDMDTACMLLVRARHYLDIIAWMDRLVFPFCVYNARSFFPTSLHY